MSLILFSTKRDSSGLNTFLNSSTSLALFAGFANSASVIKWNISCLPAATAPVLAAISLFINILPSAIWASASGSALGFVFNKSSAVSNSLNLFSTSIISEAASLSFTKFSSNTLLFTLSNKLKFSCCKFCKVEFNVFLTFLSLSFLPDFIILFIWSWFLARAFSSLDVILSRTKETSFLVLTIVAYKSFILLWIASLDAFDLALLRSTCKLDIWAAAFSIVFLAGSGVNIISALLLAAGFNCALTSFMVVIGVAIILPNINPSPIL